ncbi:uncharacterized protein SOCE26_035170 [Sorangium cellulosum]|uniref:Uncharacterized protein n=1 Tax=Sorangium cellulosum TaxID=56 RepID=A0A2L0ES47_SORCE|nr:uncharacterized protein SOCE26_035170 [Sorangium cellulosum]
MFCTARTLCFGRSGMPVGAYATAVPLGSSGGKREQEHVRVRGGRDRTPLKQSSPVPQAGSGPAADLDYTGMRRLYGTAPALIVSL